MRVPGMRGVVWKGGGGPGDRAEGGELCCAAAGRNVCRLSLPFNLLFFSPPQPTPATPEPVDGSPRFAPPTGSREIGAKR